MSTNVGTTDKVIRIVVGLALLLTPFVANLSIFDNSFAVYVSLAVGAVLVLTALMGSCPLYSIFGIKTNKV
ncbi:MAG: DUF2892 domain-containing protein [Yoonia sp.]|uniref:YgaP family membrane protein n=1 Tax=Yoonia sp. TaxID=2212373 RepID=UPI00273D4444|nr:DUF2892 domain-containing protein [Yoonia sp.]MDP5085591.1 DUF2892 domain-containing protein [Yoonia sp.]MDP5360843.1 DUF2892 domain-containing protein [Paracoccaceae bacterium]